MAPSFFRETRRASPRGKEERAQLHARATELLFPCSTVLRMSQFHSARVERRPRWFQSPPTPQLQLSYRYESRERCATHRPNATISDKVAQLSFEIICPSLLQGGVAHHCRDARVTWSRLRSGRHRRSTLVPTRGLSLSWTTNHIFRARLPPALRLDPPSERTDPGSLRAPGDQWLNTSW